MNARLAPLLVAMVAACAAPVPPPPPTAAPPPPPPPTASAPPAPPAPPPVLVARGHLLGHDGKPIRVAEVRMDGHAWRADPETGTFEITADTPGFHEIRCTAINHAERRIGLYFDGEAQSLQVQLGTYDREPSLAEAALYLFQHDTEKKKIVYTGRVVLKKLGKVYVGDVAPKNGEVYYALHNVVSGRLVNGPEADAFNFHNDGNYLSYLRSTSPKITIHVDPARLPPPGLPWSVHVDDADRRATRVAKAYVGAAHRAEDVEAGRSVDPSFRAEIAQVLARETDPDVAAALRMAYLVPPPPPGDEAAAVARALLDALPPDAIMWRFWPDAAIDAARLAGRRPDTPAYLDRLAASLKEDGVAQRFLSARLHADTRSGDDDDAKAAWAMSKARYGDDAAFMREVTPFNPARAVRPGHALPDFDLPALTDQRHPKGTRLTRAGLRGKVALVDFWGTWCIPCAEEMKYLHETWKKHKDEGFTIVSIAVNDTPAKVRTFRSARFPMPWSHVVLDDQTFEDIHDRFEVSSYPTPILVDGDGKIIAMGEDIREGGLERAVTAALAAAHH